MNMRTLMMSAYLTAMLASSVAPVRHGATLAAAFDPEAAQRAFQSAISCMNESVPAVSVPAVVPPAAPAPSADMAKLVKMTLASGKIGNLDPKATRLLGISSEGEVIPSKQLVASAGEELYVFTVSLKKDADDIIIGLRTNVKFFMYLTNSTGALRAAAVLERGKDLPVLITNEQAAEGYRTQLKVWADLIPPGNS